MAQSPPKSGSVLTRPGLPPGQGGEPRPADGEEQVSVTLEQLLREARQDGVNRDDACPFLLEPEGPPLAGVLLVHGFTATPWEMRSLAEGLAGAGYLALAVRLPGHGTRPEDLAGRNRRDWLAALTTGYRLLQERDLPVFGVGMSTGGLLLGLLASQKPLAALTLLSPFLRLAHPLAPLAGLLRRWHPYQERPLDAEEAKHYYPRRPLAGVAEVQRLARELAPRLPQLTLPVLAIASEGDETVDVASGLSLFQRLGSRHKEYHRFGPEAPHVLTTAENPFRERVLEQVLSFFAAVPGWGQAAPREQRPDLR